MRVHGAEVYYYGWIVLGIHYNQALINNYYITLYANVSRFNYNHKKTSPAVSISTYKFYMRTVR